MRKKIFALTVIASFLVSGFVVIPAQSIPFNPNNTDILMQNSDTQLESDLLEILGSITVGRVIENIRENLLSNYRETPLRTMLIKSLDNGVQSLEGSGISSTTTLLEAGNILEELYNMGDVSYHSYLINILPAVATVNTVIPPIVVNITDNNQSEFFNLKFELFVKAIPFIDRITTRQLGLIRPQLTQSAIIWPTIGGRITIGGITLFIVAFGPRIKWTEG
jgi:hypothetical protein